MKPGQTVAVLATLFLGGCAFVNETGMLVFSSPVAAQAVVHEQLLQGEMLLSPDRTGVVTLTAAKRSGPEPAPPVVRSCVGRLRYTATTAAVVDLRCNDGLIATLRMTLIGELRGYGYGESSSGLVSLVFGMSPKEAQAHLPLPPNAEISAQPFLWPFSLY